MNLKVVVDPDALNMKFFDREMFYSLLVLFLITWRTEAETCQSLSDCAQSAKCCKNSYGDVLPPREGSQEPLEITGQCSYRLGREYEQCYPKYCECSPGLECYRPISGVCCIPYQCYNATWVREDREYWDTCFRDPHCPLPP
ncbi:uncharacterized protein LOC128168024 [Crassostrea angulata]|nr:uncharacterized protein LOC128168024 [Crassostrea angulata]